MKAKGQQFTIRFICSIRNIVLNSRKDFCSQNVCTQVNWLVFIAPQCVLANRAGSKENCLLVIDEISILLSIVLCVFFLYLFPPF